MLPDRIEEILSQSPAYVTLLARDGTIRWLSSGGYGHDADDWAGAPAEDAVVPEDRPKWRELFRRARDGRQAVRYDLRLATREPPHSARVEGLLAPVVLDRAVRYVLAVTWDAPAPPPPEPPEPPEQPARVGRWLAPLGERIVALLAARPGRWVTSSALAAALGEPHGQRFKAHLTCLVDREILEARPGSGYRLAGGA